MKTIKFLLPTVIAYIFSVLAFQNFNFFTMSLGSLWVNVAYYWVVILGLLISLINLLLPQKAVTSFNGVLSILFLCVLIITGIDSLENVKHLSLLVFFTVYTAIISFINYKFS